MKAAVCVGSLLLASGLQGAEKAWTGAVDQDWNVAGNWLAEGVPGSGDQALLTNNAGTVDVQVTGAPGDAVGALTVSNINASAFMSTLSVSAPFAVQAGKLVIGENSVLDLLNGGELSYWGEASATPFVEVCNGGWVRIYGGGSLLLTNLYSASGAAVRKAYIGNGSAGRLSIGDGGTFMMGPPSTASSNVACIVGYGAKSAGLLEMEGESLFVMPRQYKSTSFSVGNGSSASGTVSLVGSAKCWVSNLVWIGSAGGTGIVTLADNAVFMANGQAGGHGLGQGSRSYGEVTVKDSAVFDASGGDDQQFNIGSSSGTGIMNVLGGSVWVRNFFYVGCGSTGVLNVSRGYVYAMGQYDRGLCLGQVGSAGAVGNGEVRLSGGALVVWPTAGAYPVGAQTGFIVGKTQAASCRSSGRVSMSGGVVTNRSFYFVGQGPGATGMVTQTGGEVVQGVGSAAERLFVGFGGGCGTYTMSNGTFTAVKDVYVGGLPDAQWPPTAAGAVDWARYVDLYTGKQSTGVLCLQGGVLTASNATVRVGGQGVGVLVIGPEAACVASDILLDTNLSSTVRFEFGPSGIGTLQATNLLTVCDGAKLEVDTTAYQGKRSWIRLVDCRARAGAFAAEDITVTGAGEVRQDIDEDIWLFRHVGTLFSIL